MVSNRQAKLLEEVRSASREMTDPAGRRVRVLEELPAADLEETFQCDSGDVFTIALEQGIWPYRYLRNRDSLSCQEQLKLARAKVAVIGSGGLGGTVILLLARIGVGCLKVIDGDVFDETNLNRQALSDVVRLGRPKALEAQKRVGAINPAVKVIARQIKVDSENARDLLGDVDVVVDALDNVADRILLDETTQALGIPLVHGAIAGFEGQLMTVLPGDPGLKRLYGETPGEKDDPARPEAVLGVPAITPSLVATLQAMEVIKILLNRGRSIRNRMLHMDLESGRFEVFKF